jgi:hypothetical protein
MRKLSIRLLSCLFLLTTLITGCASLDPNYEEPTVTLSSFKAIPSEGMIPAFEIGLRIINPNSGTLNLEGIVYTVSLQGHELIKGVGKDFPAIEGYSEGLVMLTASANLLAGIRFVTDVMREPQDSLEYEFKAKLDMGGLFPSVRISETGNVNINGQGQEPR